MTNDLDIKKRERIDVKNLVDELMHIPLSEDRISELKDAGFVVDDKYYTMLFDLTLSQVMSAAKKNNTKAFDSILSIYRESDEVAAALEYYLPAHMVARSFVDIYRSVRYREYDEYIFKGGRGSTKSTMIAEMIIELMINNPDTHALVVRKVANTLRDSVFAQFKWAISKLNLEELFKSTVSPMQIVYLPTGQTIYFRGGDEPEKIKSIKPEDGYIAYMWAEEIDQFNGAEDIRNIEQSALRGGPIAIRFKSYNSPKSKHHWINNYVLLPKPNMKVHHSTYHDVPVDWLGQHFFDEAELLKELNEDAYRHEYLGEVIGQGYNVFDNVVAEQMSDEFIDSFGNYYYGQDWGFYPDPNRLVGMSYDANLRTLYIFREEDGLRMNSEMWASRIIDLKGTYTIIADNNERKTIMDMKSYGFNMREATKGPNSVHMGMKWLAGLNKIIIDPVRCPKTFKEFINYEYDKDKEGNAITSYPDFDNHSIAAVRYAMERVSRQRGV